MAFYRLAEDGLASGSNQMAEQEGLWVYMTYRDYSVPLYTARFHAHGIATSKVEDTIQRSLPTCLRIAPYSFQSRLHSGISAPYKWGDMHSLHRKIA